MAQSLTLPALAAIVTLAGCSATPQVQIQAVRVPVPVECREPVPARPIMPTEHLTRDATVADFVRAALAELERREGYEGQLLTALDNCRAPIAPASH